MGSPEHTIFPLLAVAPMLGIFNSEWERVGGF